MKTQSRWPNRMMSMHIHFWKKKMPRKAQCYGKSESKSIYFNVFIKINGQSSNSKTRLTLTFSISFCVFVCFFFLVVPSAFLYAREESCAHRSFGPEQCLPTLFVCCNISFLWHLATSSKASTFNILLSLSTVSLVHVLIHKFMHEINNTKKGKKKNYELWIVGVIAST